MRVNTSCSEDKINSEEHLEPVQSGKRKIKKKSAGKLGTVICQMVLFDWIKNADDV